MATSTALTRRSKIPTGRIAVFVILFVGAFVAIVPFLYMLSHSLKSYGESTTRASAIVFDPDFWPQKLRWENYERAWREAKFSLYFKNSVIISVITVLGIVFVSSLASYAFAKLRFAGRDVIFAVLLMTLMIPETVLLIPNFIVVSKLGWINRLPALTVPFLGSAFFIFLLRQFFQQVPNELIESATIDGCPHPRILVSIVLPLAKAPLFTVSFLAFLGAWNALQWPMVVIQTERWRTIPVGLITFITEFGAETQLRMAGAVIAIIPILVMYFIAQKQFTEAIARSGLKG